VIPRAGQRTGCPCAKHLLRALLFALIAPGLASPAAAALSRAQSACVDGLSRALDKVDRQVTRQIAACLKSHAKEKPLDPEDPAIDTLEECATADPRGRIARATSGTQAQFEKLCTPPPAGKLEDPFPEFAATDAARVNGLGLGLAPDLAHDLFGPDLDLSLATDPAAAKCQQAAWTAATRCHQARTAAFRTCQKRALRGGGGAPGAETRDALRELCLGAGANAQQDPRGQLARTCSDPGKGIAKALTRACVGQDIEALLPGCAGEFEIPACLARQSACRACLQLSAAGDLRRSCDLFDDGEANGSCGGTSIRCESPTDGAMLAAAPGTEIELVGQVPDTSQIEGVTVDGVPVTLDEEGFFSYPVTAEHGLHFPQVAALDETGAEATRVCTFLAAESFAAEAAFLDDGLSLTLAQAAVDDGNRAGDPNSLADVLHAVWNSSGLQAQIHSTLASENPLKPMACDQTLCVPIIGCTCVLSTQVTYLSSSIGGSNTVDLDLVDGGIRTVATARGINLSLRANGSVTGIAFDTTGTISVASLTADLTSDVAVLGGELGAIVRTLSVSVGAISSNFSGLSGDVLDFVLIVVDPIRTLLVDFVVEPFARDILNNSVLDGLFAGLEIPATGLDVPRLAAPGDVALAFDAAASSASFTPVRALFGLGVRTTAPASHALPSLGVALPAGPLLGDPGAGTPVAFAGHLSALNQALHALWRGGLLHGQVDASAVAALPAGASAEIEALLPPLIAGGDGSAFLAQLGALRIRLTYPGVFDEPVLLSGGAEVTLTLAVQGGSLRLENLAPDALHVSGVDTALTAAQEAAAEDAVLGIALYLLEGALDAAAQGLPVPAFVIPPSLGPYGLPAGSALGLVDPTFEATPSHVYLKGSFGVLP